MDCVGLRRRGWRFEHVALIVYDKNSHHQLFLTCVFRECQFLCNARANNTCEHSNGVFTSDLPSYRNCLRLLVPFVGFDCPDVGTRFDSTIARNSTQRAKRKSEPVRDDRDDDANPSHLQT
jgi:hypothetical protein